MVHVCLWQRAPRNGEYAKEKRREENILFEVTNNRRLRLMCCTIEANYWQTRSIAWPLCDSRATCIMSFVYKWTPITEVCFIWLLCVLTFQCRGWGRYFAASQWHCVSCCVCWRSSVDDGVVISQRANDTVSAVPATGVSVQLPVRTRRTGPCPV